MGLPYCAEDIRELDHSAALRSKRGELGPLRPWRDCSSGGNVQYAFFHACADGGWFAGVVVDEVEGEGGDADDRVGERVDFGRGVVLDCESGACEWRRTAFVMSALDPRLRAMLLHDRDCNPTSVGFSRSV